MGTTKSETDLWALATAYIESAENAHTHEDHSFGCNDQDYGGYWVKLDERQMAKDIKEINKYAEELHRDLKASHEGALKSKTQIGNETEAI